VDYGQSSTEKPKGGIKMLKLEEQLEEQLEELIKKLKVERVEAVTIRQYEDTKLIRKSNYQLDTEDKLVLGWSKGNKKVGTITLTIEGKDFNYSEDVTAPIQQAWAHDDGCYDIQCAYKGATINISITTKED
jgi:hypothetical protein